MNIKTGYKQTEIGVIPEDWECFNLNECCVKITDGTHDTPKPVESGIPFLTAIHVKQNCIDFDGCYFLPQATHNEIFKRCNPEKNDVLMVNIGAGTATNALVNVDYEFSLKNVALLKPNYKKITGTFLNQILGSRKENIVTTLLSGGAQPFLSLTEIGQIKIPLPPLPEQTAIAAALSDVDALMGELDKLIAKKRDIKQATMQQLLTGKNRLAGFSGEWEVKNLSDIAQFTNGKAHEQFIDEAGDYIVINSKFVSTEGSIFKTSNTAFALLEVGEIAMVMSDIPNGKALAKCFLVNQHNKYTLNQRICSIKSSECNNVFLFLKLNRNKYFLAFDSGSGQTNLRRNDVLACPLEIPPTIEEQNAIATILSDMDAEISQLEARRAKTAQFKQGMMQELLTGRIRLVSNKIIGETP